MQLPFHASPQPTLGIEWELFIVDRNTRDLVSGASKILEHMGIDPRVGHPKVKNELFECIIEIITGVCDTVEEACADLAATLADVRKAANDLGYDLFSAGTHPFAHWEEQQISPGYRYHTLVDQLQWPARRLLICGIHFHVGVSSDVRVMQFLHATSYYIPHFLALSASSPYFGGIDTGLASGRSKVFEGLPTGGPPAQVPNWESFDNLVTTLISAQVIQSFREIWWDIRPHPIFGTLELRICDGIANLRVLGALAAVAQCLIVSFDRAVDQGQELPKPLDWIVRENKWSAARYGLDALIMGPDGVLMRLSESITNLVEDLMPVATDLGCQDELSVVNELLAAIPAQNLQRQMVSDGGTLVDVVEMLIRQSKQGERRTGQTRQAAQQL